MSKVKEINKDAAVDALRALFEAITKPQEDKRYQIMLKAVRDAAKVLGVRTSKDQVIENLVSISSEMLVEHAYDEKVGSLCITIKGNDGEETPFGIVCSSIEPEVVSILQSIFEGMREEGDDVEDEEDDVVDPKWNIN